MRALFLCVALCCLLPSCLPLSQPAEASWDFSQKVSLRVSPLSVRSALPYSSEQINSYVLMVYYAGRLESYVHSSSADESECFLLPSRPYRLYALANVPDFVPPACEEELLMSTLSAGDFQQGLPMAWQSGDFYMGTQARQLTLSFERLFACLHVRLDKGLMGAWTVESARLRQVAAVVHPFQKGVAAKEVCDGDRASESDLALLNQGGEVIFYVPENVQGSLLPSTADAFSRVPENLGDNASYCTYLEMDGRFEEGSGLLGFSHVRIYLGENASDDFSLPRNSELDLSLYLSEQLLSGVGWKIESHASLTEGAVEAWIAEGMHPVDQLYKGEKFRYALRPSGELRELLRENIEKCSLRCLSEEDSAIVFAPFRSFHTDGEGTWYVDATCKKCIPEGEIQLLLNGRPLLTLCKNVRIQMPDLHLTGPSTCFINSPSPHEFSLDLLDAQGRSLSQAYGFDSSLYDVRYSLQNSQAEVCPSAFTLRPCAPDSLRVGGGFRIHILHDGTDDSINRYLTESLGQEAFSVVAYDQKSTLSSTCTFHTDIRPVQLMFFEGSVPNHYQELLSEPDIALRSSCGRSFPIIESLEGYQSEFNEADWVLALHNPSQLPIEVAVVLAAAASGAQASDASVDGLAPKEIRALMYPEQRFKVVDREFITLDKNALRRGDTPYAFLTDSSWVVPLQLGSKSVERHLKACASTCSQKFMGIETSLYYASKGDDRLNGKVDVFYNASDETVNLYQFSAQRVRWISKNTLPNPSWLRYSHYDSVHDVCVYLYCQDGRMLARCESPLSSLSFDMQVSGRLTGSLFIYPDGTMWSGYWYVMKADFSHALSALPADNNTYVLPGNYWTQMDYLYSIAPIDDNTILGTNPYPHHLYPEYSEYHISLALRGDVGLVVPRYEYSLNCEYYHQQDRVTCSLRSTCLSTSGETFYLYDW